MCAQFFHHHERLWRPIRRAENPRALQRLIAGVSLAAVLSAGLVVFPGGGPSAQASGVAAEFCRSTTGDGTTKETSEVKNGFYRASNIEIEPVYTRVMYADLGANFNATYIAYRVTNRGSVTLSNHWLRLSSFDTGPISLANPDEGTQRVRDLAAGASQTLYFFIRANAYSSATLEHTVAVHPAIPQASPTPVMSCKAGIDGVRRSISANANKVTSISVSGSPVVGQTLTITVEGVPGKVGQGSSPDKSVMALSPASSATWPARSLRLESTRSVLRAVQSAAAGKACEVGNADVVYVGGTTKTATIPNTLVINNFGNCATSPKNTYTNTYVFRVIAPSGTNPVIRPLASISSGTQIKYTGSFPSEEATVPLEEVTVPISVTKSFVTSAVKDDTVEITYRLTASTTSSTEVSLDALVDTPDSRFTLLSATVTDTARTGAILNITTDRIVESTGGVDSWKFVGPFTLSAARTAVVTYVVSVAKPAASTTFTNSAYGQTGSFTIGEDGDSNSGIEATVDDSGVTTTKTISVDRDKEPQAITFEPPTTLGADTNMTLAAFSDSGLPVSFASLTTAICVISVFDGVSTLTTLAPGSCDIRATQSGDSTFAAATPVTRSITVLQAQTLSSTQTVFSSATPPTSTVVVASSARLEAVLVSLDTDVCTVSTPTYDSVRGETTYTVTSRSTAGSCILVATQAGNDTIGPAPELRILIGVGLAQTLVITAPTQGQQIERATASTTIVAGVTYRFVNFVAESRKGNTTEKTVLPVSVTSETGPVCRVSQTQSADGIESGMSNDGVTTVKILLLAAGECRLVANQDGTDDKGESSAYAPANPVSRTFTILPGGTEDQVLAFTAADRNALVSGVTYGGSNATLRVTSLKGTVASEGSIATSLAVTLLASSAVCVLSSASFDGTTTSVFVSWVSAGTCVITARQPGNDTFKAAPEIEVRFEVGRKIITATGLSISPREYDGTTTATVAGTPGLSGVVGGDTSSAINVTGIASGVFSTASVISGDTIAVTGLSLGGTKVSSYELAPLDLLGSISARVITIRATNDTTAEEALPSSCPGSVTVGSIAIGDTLGNVTCAYQDGDDDVAATDVKKDKTYTIAITEVALARDGVDVRANYSITFLPGVLNVSSVPVPDLVLEPIVLDYGQSLSDALGSGATARVGDTEVAGSFAYALVDKPIDERVYGAGSFSLEVRFTPGNAAEASGRNSNRSVTIRQRPVTVTVGTWTKFVGDPDPTFVTTLEGSVLAGETLVEVAGTPAVQAAGRSGSGVGSVVLTVANQTTPSPNYKVTVVPGVLHVADVLLRATVEDGVVTSPELDCACEGFKPNSPVTVTLFSDPVVLVSGTINEFGECPFTTATIPDTMPPGDHTLELSGLFPNGDPAVRTLALRLPEPEVSVSVSGETAPASQGTGPSTVRTAIPGIDTLSSPRFFQPIVSVQSDGMAPAVPQGGTPRPQLGRPIDTVDFGVAGALGATISIDQLAAEQLAGFRPGSSAVADVIGSRTTARFILSSLSGLDSKIIAPTAGWLSIPESADFAALTAVTTATPPATPRSWSIRERVAAEEMFVYTRLPKPVVIDEVLQGSYDSWVQFSTTAHTYRPGSTVYLTVTSSPIVIGQATVDANGAVTLEGSIPTEVLGIGEHRVRVVGVRVFSGISTDMAGEIIVPHQIMAAIRKFDPSTTASVVIRGVNDSGGTHTVMRVIWLEPTNPWWSLLIILGTAAAMAVVLWRRKIPAGLTRVAAGALIVVSMTPAVYLGWTSTVMAAMWWGIALGLTLSVLPWVVRHRGHEEFSLPPNAGTS